ncbi:MAG: ATP-binding protein [Acidobacteriota bacterium]|jgi:signal transduction histidine kinase
MTFRLVGLMTLVLLICLASFAVLLNHYQGELRDEVTRTVSQVGKATLSTLEYRFPTGPAVIDVAPFEGGGAAGGPHARLGGHDPAALRERVRRIQEEAEDGNGTFGFVIVQRTASGPAGIRAGEDCEEAIGDDCLAPAEGTVSVSASFSDAPDEVDNSFVIHLDAIRADTDPARGTFLRIPTFHAAADADGQVPTEGEQLFWTTEQEAAAVPAAMKQDIILPIATDQFDELLEDFRAQTLFLFLAVFLLGMLLSVSLASRFTRPVRRLDAGIRRLSEGDLDVQVEAHGRDEVGRLGRAFNEMARRLRASRDRERELTRREKLSALGRLAAGVAHDVRNPLHSIGLTLQHLREAARPSEPGRVEEFDRSVEIIRQEVHRLDGLVGNFLRFARSDRRSRAPIDLPELLRDTVRLVEKEAERRGIQVKIVTEGDVRSFPADPESIRSSILNLVMNSFEAMKSGGTLTLRLRGEPDEVILEVADTGCGIPREDQERVFEFAYTTRDDGHGLGLAMVHQVVVEDHGGRISLDSRPGEGTRVRMAFPLAAAGGA